MAGTQTIEKNTNNIGKLKRNYEIELDNLRVFKKHFPMKLHRITSLSDIRDRAVNAERTGMLLNFYGTNIYSKVRNLTSVIRNIQDIITYRGTKLALFKPGSENFLSYLGIRGGFIGIGQNTFGEPQYIGVSKKKLLDCIDINQQSINREIDLYESKIKGYLGMKEAKGKRR